MYIGRVWSSETVRFVRHSRELHQSTPHYPSSAILYTATPGLAVGERGEAQSADRE